MTNLTKTILGALSLAGIAAATPAFADDAPAAPAWALAGTIDMQSDYKFRGISQNERNPSPQATLNLTAPDGFYAGTWLSTIDFTPGPTGNPYLEMDIYGGKHTDLWGVDWNIEPYYYSYPAENYPGAPQSDYFELINQFTKAFGPFTAQATYAWSPSFAFRTGAAHYLAGNLAYTVNDWLSVSGNLGHQWVSTAKANGSRDYTYADIGVTATWKMFSLDVRYSGTDLHNTQCGFYMGTHSACAGDFIATLSYNFALWP
jgi:uncharacterized protein (TIGR02001 family)